MGARLRSDLSGGHPDVAMAVMAGLVVLCLIALLRAHRRRSAAVRLALWDPHPDVRRAGVLVAARAGIGRHADLLLSRARYEVDEDILFALARAVRDRGCPGRGSRATLRRWSEAFLSTPATSGSRPRDKGFATLSRGSDPGLDVGGIDALELLEAVPPTSRAGAGEPCRLPSLYGAGPGQLDPLAVLAALDGRPSTERTSRPASRHHGDRDYEALLDRLVGIAPKRHPAGSLPGNATEDAAVA